MWQVTVDLHSQRLTAMGLKRGCGSRVSVVHHWLYGNEEKFGYVKNVLLLEDTSAEGGVCGKHLSSSHWSLCLPQTRTAEGARSTIAGYK